MAQESNISYSFGQWYQFQDKQLELFNAMFKAKDVGNGKVNWVARREFSYIFYGGARGGGKTDVSIAISCFVALQYPGIQIAFIRETMPEMENNIIPRFLELFPEGELYEYNSKYRIKFYNGSTIKFTSFDNPANARKEMGIERQLYIVDEAPNLDPEIIQKLKGSLRNSRIKDWEPIMLMTGNPGGKSDWWFQRYFIGESDGVRPFGKINYHEWEEAELIEKDKYKFIFADVEDNQILLANDPGYERKLLSLPLHLRMAWRYGVWGQFTGKFFEEWREDIHILEHGFRIPENWLKWRSVDLGKGSKAHPSVCGWFTQDPVSGRLFMYREFMHTGTTQEFAQGIATLSPPEEEYMCTFADPNIFAGNNDTYDNSQYFEAEGIYLEKADNSRVIGWRNVKNWLHWAPPGENGAGGKAPMLQFFPGCEGVKKCFGKLLYAQKGTVDDCDTKAFDDPADMVRYATSGLPYTFIFTPGGGTVKPKYDPTMPSDMDQEWFRKKNAREERVEMYARQQRAQAIEENLDGWGPDRTEYYEPIYDEFERNGSRGESLYSMF